MFEKAHNKKQDDIIDIFNKYQSLFAEYVDPLIYERQKVRPFLSPEDAQQMKRYEEISLENPEENYEIHLKSKIFEGALVKFGKKIFGENIETIPSTEYDDWVNKFDMFITHGDSQIGIDATLCKDTLNTERKNGEIFSDIERLNEKDRGKEKFHVKYFMPNGKKEAPIELHGIPRVIIGIHADYLEKMLLEIKNGNSAPFKLMFLNMIKSQLEDQFIFALGVNGEKKDKEDKTYKTRVPEPIKRNVREVYPLCAKAVKSDWNEEKIKDLFISFEKNKNLFALKQFSFPEYHQLLSNIQTSWNWVSSELANIKKESSPALLNETEVENRLRSHINEDQALKHRPFLA